MKANLVWEMNVAELERKEQELYDQIFKLRFQLTTGQMDNPRKMRLVKKDLARVKTILHAKRKSAGESGVVQEAKEKELDKGTGADQKPDHGHPTGNDTQSSRPGLAALDLPSLLAQLPAPSQRLVADRLPWEQHRRTIRHRHRSTGQRPGSWSCRGRWN